MTKLAGILGLAVKAGQVVAGTAPVTSALHKKQLQLVICARDLAPRTIRNFQRLAQQAGVDWYLGAAMADLSNWIGKPGRGVVGITSRQFAKLVRDCLNERNGVDDH